MHTGVPQRVRKPKHPHAGKRELYHPAAAWAAGSRRVSTRGPFAVIATVCSQCEASVPSAV